MAEVPNTCTPLPPKPDRVPVESLVIKEAVGFGLWNGQFGTSARLYLAKMNRADHIGDIVRYFGGTAIPQSTVSSWNQSLIRTQDYLGESLNQELIVDFAVLHRACYFAQEMYSDPALPGSDVQSQTQHIAAGFLSHSAPGFETHGILAVPTALIERHRAKLVELRVDLYGAPCVTPNLAFNNHALVAITRHILACLFFSKLRCTVSTSLTVDRDEAPYLDTSPVNLED